MDARDKKNHQGCLTAFQSFKTAPLTTWPCVAEASYLLGQINGWPAQKMLLDLLKSGAISIHETTAAELARIEQLMEQYQNVPVDLADASLVALAELRGLAKSSRLTTTSSFTGSTVKTHLQCSSLSRLNHGKEVALRLCSQPSSFVDRLSLVELR
ncbi:MAG: hypothetical protein M3X11_08445 [Acidobacteriota bacterium]|nr:hypothetical protein [Acidobacteriota bacterium]